MSDVKITIRAIDEASKVFKRTGSALENTFKQSTNSAESFSKKLNTSWDSMLSTIGGVAAGVYAVKKAYNFAKEGAELDLMSQRFENVATNAGYAADVLLGKMKDATGGLVTDAELTASALQIIELGLANTEGGVVDLAEAIAVLGLDMQQVIMTFSNNSELRLDSLGLSVEKVKNRVAELNAEGFDGDAFDQAVIEGLTERMEVLGDVAETDAGKIKRFETSLQNLADAAKKKVAPSLATAADGIALLLEWGNKVNAMYGETKDRIIETSHTYDEYISRMVQVVAMENSLTDEMAEGLRVDILNRDATYEEIAAYGLLTAEQWSALQIQEALTAATVEAIAEAEGLTESEEELAQATKEAAEAAAIAEQHYKDMFSAADQDWVSIWGQMNDAYTYIMAGGEAFSHLDGTINAVNTTWAGLSADARNEFGPGIQNALLLGEIAAIKMNQELGNIDVDETQEALMNLGLGVEEAFGLATDMTYDWKGAAYEARDALIAINREMLTLDGMTSEMFVNVYYTEYGRPGPPGGAQPGSPGNPTPGDNPELPDGPIEGPADLRAVGGPVYAGQSYYVGEIGPELFVPQTSGTIIPNNRISQGGGGIDETVLISLFTRLSSEIMNGIEMAMARVT